MRRRFVLGTLVIAITTAAAIRIARTPSNERFRHAKQRTLPRVIVRGNAIAAGSSGLDPRTILPRFSDRVPEPITQPTTRPTAASDSRVSSSSVTRSACVLGIGTDRRVLCGRPLADGQARLVRGARLLRTSPHPALRATLSPRGGERGLGDDVTGRGRPS